MRRRQNETHVAPFKSRRANIVMLVLAKILRAFDHSRKQLPPKFGMGHLTTTKHDRYLDLVSLFEEFSNVIRFRVEIVIVDFRTVLDLFHGDGVLMLARLLRPLALLIAILPIVHNAAYGRYRLACNLHQIQAALFRFADGINGTHNPKLIPFFVDHTNLTGPNHSIYSDLFLFYLGDRCILHAGPNAPLWPFIITSRRTLSVLTAIRPPPGEKQKRQRDNNLSAEHIQLRLTPFRQTLCMLRTLPAATTRITHSSPQGEKLALPLRVASRMPTTRHHIAMILPNTGIDVKRANLS